MVSLNKVGVAAYGSIVNNLTSANYGGATLHLKEGEKFEKSGFTLPIKISRIAGLFKSPAEPRAVVALDATGEEVPMFVANHREANWKKAQINLQEREGMGTRALSKNVTRIVLNNDGTVNHSLSHFREGTVLIHHLNKVTQFMKGEGYKVLLFTDLPPNKNNEEVKEYLSDPVAMERSRGYYNTLPEPTKEALKTQAEGLGISPRVETPSEEVLRPARPAQSRNNRQQSRRSASARRPSFFRRAFRPIGNFFRSMFRGIRNLFS